MIFGRFSPIMNHPSIITRNATASIFEQGSSPQNCLGNTCRCVWRRDLLLVARVQRFQCNELTNSHGLLQLQLVWLPWSTAGLLAFAIMAAAKPGQDNDMRWERFSGWWLPTFFISNGWSIDLRIWLSSRGELTTHPFCMEHGLEIANRLVTVGDSHSW